MLFLIDNKKIEIYLLYKQHITYNIQFSILNTTQVNYGTP